MKLRLTDIQKHYAGVAVLDNISLTLNGQEKIGLVGANGAGKSTFMEIVAGNLAMDSGSRQLAPHSVLAYLPQKMPQDFQGTVYDYVLAGYQDFLELEEALATTLERLSAGQDALEASERHQELFERYQVLGYDKVRSQAKEILSGLGLPEHLQAGPLQALSGGLWMRAALARLLLMSPDILLLDEPTNHLDIAGLLWLEQYLQKFTGSFVLISHDRWFLDHSCQQIAELYEGKLTLWSGNYSQYLVQKAAKALQEEQAYEKYQEEKQATMAFVARFGAKASKAKAAQSRLKRFEQLDEVVIKPEKIVKIKVQLPSVKPCADPVWQMQAVTFAYNSGDRPLYHKVSQNIPRGAKWAVVGPNGAGKTTLLQLLSGKRHPKEGQIHTAQGVQLGMMAQQEHEIPLVGSDVLSCAQKHITLPESKLRSLLASFGFSQHQVFKPLEKLSGGERNRLQLALLCGEGCNVLLLDEPTNHLDLQSRASLEEALQAYQGSLLFVSHDRYFIQQVANGFLMIAGDGSMQYSRDEPPQWHDASLNHLKRDQKSTTDAEQTPLEPSKIKVQKSQRKAERQKERHIQQLEAKIATIEQQQSLLEVDLLNPQKQKDYLALMDTQLKLEAVRHELDKLITQWEAIMEKTPE